MKNIVNAFLCLIVCTSINCNSSKMGKTKYGKDSAIESGSATTRCTHPTKRYTKGLEMKVKVGIDSLSLLPSQNLDAEVRQTVTRLSDYSSEGLDIDLVLFHLCEISINKGFTKDQTSALFQNAIDAWSKKNSSK
ncbi:MAG: hypothetical protein WKG06_45315 [Segetibacter sp.]